MKKISLILAAMVLFAGISFANPVVKKGTQKTTKTEKTSHKSSHKGGKKASRSSGKTATK